ncbi:TPA: hypothetical protein P0E36_004879 [Vibrio harveyi]|nr:hypothetical protein [Vibrio harveyi]
MSDIQVFNKPLFGDLTVIRDNEGDPWFVANEVGSMIGLVNVRESLKKHVKDQHKKPLKELIAELDPSRSMTDFDKFNLDKRSTILSESGMYRLIMRTDAAKAAFFQDWVTDEVLPTIRKTGSYQVTRRPMSKLEILAEQSKALVDIERNQINHDQRIKQLESQIRQVTEGAPEGWGLVTRLATHYGLSKQKGKDLCAAYELETKKISVGEYSQLTDMVEIELFKMALGTELKAATLSDNKKWFVGGRLGRFQAKGILLDKYLKFKGEHK